MQKKLYRSRNQVMVEGVCGGLAEYFSVDVTLIRLAWIALAFVNFFTGMIVYILAAIIIPKGPAKAPQQENIIEHQEDYTSNENNDSGSGKNKVVLLMGLGFIVLGGISLMDRIYPIRHFFRDARVYAWPVLLIVIGGIIIISGARKK